MLEWVRPLTSLEEPHAWLAWIESRVQGTGAREPRSSAKGISKAACPSIVILVASVLTIAPLHRAGSPSALHRTIRAEPLHATSSAIRGTILSLGPQTLTHNTAKVSVLLTYTNADLINYNIDLVGTGASEMGGMVEAKGGGWEDAQTGSRRYCAQFA